ncbi:hypothetical protein L1987_40498 [Smallanthus sonchifolius]|uniref:Uncharacterized protein n=1 Tax=Smallanthus sonchifolius TaxID=185202 RepID=A0ACB9GT93_9ASTR|nr:hypothetical protein L1987_40498 [Smallanthus sonchifolius]
MTPDPITSIDVTFKDQSILYSAMLDHSTRCSVTGTSGGAIFLGRAWGDYSRIVYLYCHIDNIIDPSGWSDMNVPSRQRTTVFGEYECRGKGADRKKRVSWSKSFKFEEAVPFLDRDVACKSKIEEHPIEVDSGQENYCIQTEFMGDEAFAGQVVKLWIGQERTSPHEKDAARKMLMAGDDQDEESDAESKTNLKQNEEPRNYLLETAGTGKNQARKNLNHSTDDDFIIILE